MAPSKLLDQRGSATLLSIFLSAIIITLGLAFNWFVKEHLKVAEGFRLKTEAMVKVYSTFDAITYALLNGTRGADRLLTGADEVLGVKEIPMNGEAVRLRTGAEVELRDANSLVSLLGEDASTLKRLVTNLSGTDGSVFVDSYLDWIDGDSATRPSGAEEPYYSYAGAGYKPRNAPVEYKEELLLVRGMDKALYRKIAPYVTLMPASGFNPNTAAVPVTMASLGVDEETAKALRKAASTEALTDSSGLMAATGKMTQSTLEYEFVASPYVEVTVRSGAAPGFFRINAGVYVARGLDIPVNILYWRED